MSVSVNVSLLSGRMTAIAATADTPVAEIKKRAQRDMEIPLNDLVDSAGRPLKKFCKLQEVGVKDGDTVNATVRRGTLCSKPGRSKAFALLNADGTVKTWGDTASGGDSSSVRDQLKDVTSIVASESAFAALSRGWKCGYMGLSRPRR